LEPRRTPYFFQSTRSRRQHPSRLARRVGAAVGLVALAVAAGAAAWHAEVGPFAAASDARRLAASTRIGIARAAASPVNQHVALYASAGVALACIPLALFFRRRREAERQRAATASLQQERAPRVFEASLAPRPLRRATPPAAISEQDAASLPAPDPVSPEVAARAAALQAGAVREAAARAVMLRAASERSETRRRAAALRARARRDESAATPTPVEPTLESEAASHETTATPSAQATPARVTPLRLAATTPIRPAPQPAPEAPLAAAPAPLRAEPDTSAAAVSQRSGRVALLHSSGTLTFEWLEQCLARDPKDTHARLDLCTALLVAERFADAERVARAGLENDANDGRLLLRLSEALSGLERNDDALEIAVRAVRGHRSRKAILHLTRLSAVARRFSPGDGARLRRALGNRPNDPVFLHALGAFEVQRGNPREALPILRLALRQERSPRWRRVVSREIAELRAEELASASGRMQRAAS
jgi:tetratricopeptide (TPR) repeat protein